MRPQSILCFSLISTTLLVSVAPALAWWQFAWQEPPGERKISSRFTTEKECQAVLKQTEARLEKKYPNPEHFPLTGSCEESH